MKGRELFRRWKQRSEAKRLERATQEVSRFREESQAMGATFTMRMVEEDIQNGNLQRGKEMRAMWEKEENNNVLLTALGHYMDGLQSMIDPSSFAAIMRAVREAKPLPPQQQGNPVVTESIRRMRVLGSILQERGELP